MAVKPHPAYLEMANLAALVLMVALWSTVFWSPWVTTLFYLVPDRKPRTPVGWAELVKPNIMVILAKT